MSGTYTHGLKARERYYASPWKDPRNEWHDPLRGSRPKLKRHKQEVQWMNTPSSWNYVMHTRPWRRRVDAAIRRALDRPWEDVVMPDWDKPHVYYW
jgi:hypothetical protein